MRRVVVESPYAGKTPAETAENVAFAKHCVRDCLMRGEAPIASHLLFTQPGILDDSIQIERSMGMRAGFAWSKVAEAVIVYTARGISAGMQSGITVASKSGIPVEFRSSFIVDALLEGIRESAERDARALAVMAIATPTPKELSEMLVTVGVGVSPEELAELLPNETDVAPVAAWARAMHRHAQGETVEIPAKPSWIDTLA